MKVYQLILGVILVSIVQLSFGQKLKYKNIYPLLESKNYAQGEPMLRQFLKDPKNSEEPNANLQLAYILEINAEKLHVVSDSTALIKTADSTAIAFQKARMLIDEKELKRNSDYYQAFYRRDLRTGEFGIKLDDISLEIENKIEKYRLVSRKTRELTVALPLLETVYNESNEIFKELALRFATVNELALSTNEDIQEKLRKLIDNGDRIDEILDDIQTIVATHPKADFNASVELMPIANYVTDGREKMDVFEGDFKVWDYKSFAEGIIQKVAEEITDFKRLLVEVDKDFQNKLATVNRAETLMQPPVIPDDLESKIEELDAEGLPGNILRFRMNEIAYKNLDLIDEDSAFVTKQLRKVDTMYQIISKMDAIFSKITARNTDAEKQKYQGYVKAIFGRSTQVNKYVAEQEVWLRNRRSILDRSFEYWSEINKWGIGEGYRIPLFIPETLEGYDLNYLAKMIDEEDDYNMNAFGFKLDESPYVGYVARVNSAREIQWMDNFKLESTSIETLTDNYNYELLPSEDDRITFVLSYVDGINKPKYHYFSYLKEGEKLWDHEFELDAAPFNVKFNDLTKETIIYLNDPDNLPAGTELSYIVIDRAGKARR